MVLWAKEVLVAGMALVVQMMVLTEMVGYMVAAAALVAAEIRELETVLLVVVLFVFFGMPQDEAYPRSHQLTLVPNL